MHIIGTVIIGFIVGLVARAVHPGDDKLGFIATTALGIGGAFLATYGGQALHFYQPGEAAGFIGATVGAIVVLVIVGLLRRKST